MGWQYGTHGVRIVANRTVFRDPLSGRFISAQAAYEQSFLREVYGPEGELLSSDQSPSLSTFIEEATGTPNWQSHPTSRGVTWMSDEDPLDIDALSAEPYPEGAVAFRVVFRVPRSFEYSRGFASSDWVLGDQWPPDLSMGQSAGAIGIDRIYFDMA